MSSRLGSRAFFGLLLDLRYVDSFRAGDMEAAGQLAGQGRFARRRDTIDSYAERVREVFRIGGKTLGHFFEGFVQDFAVRHFG